MLVANHPPVSVGNQAHRWYVEQRAPRLAAATPVARTSGPTRSSEFTARSVSSSSLRNSLAETLGLRVASTVPIGAGVYCHFLSRAAERIRPRPRYLWITAPRR